MMFLRKATAIPFSESVLRIPVVSAIHELEVGIDNTSKTRFIRTYSRNPHSRRNYSSLLATRVDTMQKLNLYVVYSTGARSLIFHSCMEKANEFACLRSMVFELNLHFFSWNLFPITIQKNPALKSLKRKC